MSLTYGPSSLTKGARIDFMRAVGLEDSLINRIAMFIPSDAKTENYPWLGETAQLQEVVDEVVSTPMSDQNYALTNVEYGRILEVKRGDIKADVNGSFRMRIAQMAARAARHPNKLLIDLLINGSSATLGLDITGEPFFNNTHTARGSSGAGDNVLQGSGTTSANVATDINAAVAKLISVKDEAGEPYGEGIKKIALVYPPALNKQMMEATKATIVANTSNVQFAGLQVDLIPTGRITADVNDFYTLNTTGPMMPLIFQQLEALRFEGLEDGSDAAFTQNIWKYKVQAMYKAGYGLWQLAVHTVNT